MLKPLLLQLVIEGLLAPQGYTDILVLKSFCHLVNNETIIRFVFTPAMNGDEALQILRYPTMP